MTTPTNKPTLREQLDALRPDSDDLLDDSLQDAVRAIEESDEWREVFERQQAIDREVAATMQQVDVPADLKDRLLSSLATAPSDEPFAAGDQPTAPLHRRRVMQIAVTAAALLLTATLGWLIWPHDGPLITLDEARHQLPTGPDSTTINVSTLPAFDESFAVDWPDSGWQQRTRPEAEYLRGLDWNDDGRHDAALYEFRAGPVHGYLLILPTARLSDPPTLTRLSNTGIDYHPVPNAAWVNPDQERTYICYVDAGDLPTLQRLLYPHTA